MANNDPRAAQAMSRIRWAPAFAVVITQSSYSSAFVLAAAFPLLAAAVVPVAAEGGGGLAVESSG